VKLAAVVREVKIVLAEEVKMPTLSAAVNVAARYRSAASRA
jgi:hypothetical protein